MKTYTLRCLLLGILATMVTSCDIQSGYPEVLNQIPNVQLIRGEGYFRDLEGGTRVFRHTGGATLYYDAFTTNDTVADARIQDGRVYVTAGVAGIATIRVEAEDSDGESAFTTFQVTVTNTKK
jgi:hypothetical protein